MSYILSRLGLAGGFALAITTMASAETIKVTITNNSAADGVYLTPLFTAFHDGTFDPFDVGAAASPAVEDLAEEGDATGLVAEAGARTNGVITSPGGFAGAPVIDPGETASAMFDVDAATERYLTFLSMIIPSNDLFIGNDNPFAYEIFDASGNFASPGTIELFASDIWDAGTEFNNNVGAAFNAAGGTGTDQNGTVAVSGDLGFLLGQNTADATTIGSLPGASSPFATIQIAQVAAIPLPAGLPLLMVAFGTLALVRRRRP